MNPNYYKKQKERALVRKLELIENRGNKCEICGYDKNLSALEFHHLNPKEKLFQLDSRHLSNTSTERIKEEIKKCIVVCANCHRELHNPKMDINNIPHLLEEMTSKYCSVKKENKKSVCEICGKEFKYTNGRIYCCETCRNIATGKDKYPSYEEIMSKYDELKTWNSVANHFGLTRKVIQGIRKRNKSS